MLRTTLTYVVPIQLSIGTGANRIAASAVPRIRLLSGVDRQLDRRPERLEDLAAILVEDLVGSLGPCSAGVEGRRAGTVMPAGPRFLSKAAFHAPSCSIFLTASVILVHSSVSPFFRPMP